MNLLIVTGLSGAGKSKAINALEDIDYFCVDNVPPMIVPKFAEIYSQENKQSKPLALVVDARGGEMFDDFIQMTEVLRSANIVYKILFLDAGDDILLKRYKETRRKHPLVTDPSQPLSDIIKKERETLRPVYDIADFVLDTTQTSPTQLKKRIREAFENKDAHHMLVQCLSFGYKHGLPPEADIVFDVRFLPNPFYVPEMRERTGLEKDVRDFALDNSKAQVFLTKLYDMLDYLLPQYLSEERDQLVIAIGCTGGKHRSVAVAQEIYQRVHAKGMRVSIVHRDKDKPNHH